MESNGIVYSVLNENYMDKHYALYAWMSFLSIWKETGKCFI
jgi:hypothetical protein